MISSSLLNMTMSGCVCFFFFDAKIFFHSTVTPWLSGIIVDSFYTLKND